MNQRRNVGTLAAVLLMAGTHGAGSEPAKDEQPSCDRGAFRIVLDVGHTPEVPGAVSARGVSEFEFNRNLAKQIESKLTDAGYTKTALIVTTGPSRPGLLKRVTRANRLPADLFLSIHHDSVPEKFKEVWEYLGKQHRFSDRFKGHSLFVSYDNPARKSSLQFAHMLGRELKARDLQYTPHYTEAIMGRYQRELVDAEAGVYRFDKLVVLRATHMPAVLLEAGSIVNRDEEEAMASPERQAAISDAVAAAVDTFCAARRPATPALIARKPAAPTGATYRPASATSHALPAKRP